MLSTAGHRDPSEAARTLANMRGSLLYRYGPHPTVWPALPAIAALILGLLLAPERADLRFYETASQVIPVLLLALVLEARFFQSYRLPPPDPSDAEAVRRYTFAAESHVNSQMFRLFILVLLTAGEIVALAALMKGNASQTDPQWVFAPMAAALAAICVWAVFGDPARRLATRNEDRAP
jgi:hypothetical protein